MAGINDLVLIYLDHKPAFYARVEDISPDVKPGWYQVELLVLTLPPQSMVWILEGEHLQGAEFTMGGRPVRLAPVPRKAAPPPDRPGPGEKGKIIPLTRNRK
ncbi:MAG: hypothetical protein JRI59_07515 [Deltaproteobacteria bacterium]|nr:hypothetical protein [Deltaproteobacteria bacterium]